MFYVCSLSSRTIIYKGMLACEQVLPFYPDLTDPDYKTHLAMVHSRFSTNTFPSWDRAQPLRFLSHNGEINTLRGNKNWMHARQGVVESELFGDDLRKLFPVVELGLSDSGTLDNVLEFLLMNGRTLPEAVMMMIPEAWQKHEHMPQAKRAFYEYHSCLMEPWDGPASIAFTDGTIHRRRARSQRPAPEPLLPDPRRPRDHGLRGRRAAGAARNVKDKGRLQPGRMFLVDFEQGRMIPDEELKNDCRHAPSLRRVAQRAAPQADRATGARRRARLRPRDAAAAHAGLRLHHRDDAVHAAAADRAEARSGRLDGQRLGARVS